MASAIELTAARTGAFGNPRHLKVVWTGISGGLAALRALHARTAKETFKFGQRPDERIL